jgi:hypothetical protein
MALVADLAAQRLLQCSDLEPATERLFTLAGQLVARPPASHVALQRAPIVIDFSPRSVAPLIFSAMIV